MHRLRALHSAIVQTYPPTGFRRRASRDACVRGSELRSPGGFSPGRICFMRSGPRAARRCSGSSRRSSREPSGRRTARPPSACRGARRCLDTAHSGTRSTPGDAGKAIARRRRSKSWSLDQGDAQFDNHRCARQSRVPGNAASWYPGCLGQRAIRRGRWRERRTLGSRAGRTALGQEPRHAADVGHFLQRL